MSGKLLNLTHAQIVQRAKDAVKDTVKYHLDYPNGGSNPESDRPWDKLEIKGHVFNVADCIGFSLWCAGIARHFTGNSVIPPFPDTPSIGGNYINCASVVEEATGFKRRTGQPDYIGGRFFKRVMVPTPGDLIVFKAKNGKHGHIGVITSVPAEAPLKPEIPANWIQEQKMSRAVLMVAHCSPYNEKHHNNAVAITDAMIWKKTNPMFVRLNTEELFSREVH